MAHAPPVVRLAFAFVTGVSWGIMGAPLWTAPFLVIVYIAAPNATSRRPTRGGWVLIALIGAAAVRGVDGAATCALPIVGLPAVLDGRFLASPRTGSAPFHLATGCGSVTVVVSNTSIVAGVPITLRGIWMAGRRRPWFRARESRVRDVGAGSRFEDLAWLGVRWRAAW